MDDALTLVGRELLMLVSAWLIGAFPAALIDERHVPRFARFCLAPVLGLCLGTSVFMTLLWFFPARKTYYLVPVLAVGSLAGALWLRRSSTAAYRLRSPRAVAAELGKVALIVVVVSAPLISTLAAQRSVGPVTYDVYDTVGYVAVQDAAGQLSIPDAQHIRPPFHNLIDAYDAVYLDGPQEIDIAPLDANLNELVGLHATDTQSAYLLAVLVAGALAMFAVIAALVGSETPFALFGAVLFAGPFFMQLFFDGSEGAISGLCLLAPLGLLGMVALRSRRPSSAVPLGVAAAGMVALYPIYLLVVLATAAVALTFQGVRRWRQGRPSFETVRLLIEKLLLTAVFAVGLDIVAAERAEVYWRSLVHGGFVSAAGLPRYHLSTITLLGWLFGTRPFYSFALGGGVGVDVLTGVVVPLVFIAVCVSTLWRGDLAAAAAVALVICVAIAAYEVLRYACSYCEDRNLLPAGLLLIFLLGSGVACLGTSPRASSRVIAGGVVLVALVSVGWAGLDAQRQFAAGSYFLPDSVRASLSGLPAHPGNVEVEGFTEGARAPGEVPLVYELVEERSGGGASFPGDVADNSGLAYFGTYPLPGPQFRPGYSYVLTRLPAIRTERRIVDTEPGVALEARVRRLDVTVDSGLGVPPRPQDNPTGAAYVSGPLRFLVAGSSSSPAYVTLQFALPPQLSAPDEAMVRAAGRPSGGLLTLCRRAVGQAPVRAVSLDLPVGVGIRMTAMSAAPGRCPAVPTPPSR